jgi:hypothetical protein
MSFGQIARWVRGLADPADPHLTDAERIERLSQAEDLKNMLAAAQARLTVELAESVRARHRDLRLPAAVQGRGVASQVALARRESPAKGSRLAGLAAALVRELPHTLAAMESGRLSEWRATLVARETACLSVEDRRAVDAQLFADPARTEGWGDRRLASEAKAIAYRLDPASVARRSSRAESERRVGLRPAPDTMASLHALLPVAQGVAVWATLSAVADTLVATGDGRSRGQIMADTLVARVTGQAAAAAVAITVDVTVSDTTLLGGGSDPAWLHGYGPIPAQTVRDLAATAHAAGLAALRRLYVAPETGRLVAMDATTELFPDRLGAFLDLRDQTCRTPWCDAPIRHHDHITGRAAGGPTTAPNGQGLCAQCNHAKQAPGWRAHPVPGPPGTPHTVETTTPTGHRHRSAAPGLPRPSPDLRHLSVGELYYSNLVLVA